MYNSLAMVLVEPTIINQAITFRMNRYIYPPYSDRSSAAPQLRAQSYWALSMLTRTVKPNPKYPSLRYARGEGEPRPEPDHNI